MNKRNEWQEILRLANEDIKRWGMEIRVVPDGPGVEIDDAYKTVVICDNGSETTFADNYFEDELDSVIYEAWHECCQKGRTGISDTIRRNRLMWLLQCHYYPAHAEIIYKALNSGKITDEEFIRGCVDIHKMEIAQNNTVPNVFSKI